MTEAASGYDRQHLEKYYTPEWAIRAVIDKMNIKPFSIIYDPAAGDGAVIRAAHNAGFPAYGSDIAPDRIGIEQMDFLADHRQRAVVVTNPPFGTQGSLAMQFIEHALEVTKSLNGKVAMLLRSDFDSASTRSHVFRDHPAFDQRVILTKRIRWTNVVQVPGKGPSQNHVWFCWDWSRPTSVLPVIRYAP